MNAELYPRLLCSGNYFDQMTKAFNDFVILSDFDFLTEIFK